MMIWIHQSFSIIDEMIGNANDKLDVKSKR